MKNEAFDIIVVGGGVVGIGIAMAAVREGYKVALLERRTIGSGTSKNSLRIIHGGLRYLQGLNLGRTVESAQAQADLLKEYPHYIKPLRCITPLNSVGLKSPFFSRLGILGYKFLTKRANSALPSPKLLTREFVKSEIPALSNLPNHSYLLWHDAYITSYSNLIIAMIEKLTLGTIRIIEQAKVTKITSLAGTKMVTYEKNEVEQALSTKVVVNATGPWLDSMLSSNINKRRAKNQWAKAYNVVLDFSIDDKYAIAVPSREGRLFFAVPRGPKTVIGTGYLPHVGSPDDLMIPEEHVAAFVNDFASALKGPKVPISNIEKVESGILPAERTYSSDAVLVGNSQIHLSEGYCEILSTKLTTFNVLAKHTMRKIDRYMNSIGYSKELAKLRQNT